MRITLLIDSIDPTDLRDVLGAHQSALLDHDAPASIEATISNRNNGGMVVSICGSAFNAKSVTLDVEGAALMLQELGLRLR